MIVVLLSQVTQAFEVKLVRPDKGNYSRVKYSERVLDLALKKSQDKYGDYKLKYTFRMTRDRSLLELEKGTIDVCFVPTRIEWEERALPIFIPVERGLLS